DMEWGYANSNTANPHYFMFHRELPIIASKEDPATLYWISSPNSPDRTKTPNDPTEGDQHPWYVSIGQTLADWWHYRSFVDRFPNEGGVLGASVPATLRQFLPEAEQRPFSLSWDHHDNPFACQNAHGLGLSGRTYETLKLWTGLEPEKMNIDDYSFISGLLQCEGISEYIANYRRRMFSSASAIFWMYNDSWPVTHGWTIVDYYLRKKASYHPVRRAFEPVTAVVAEENGVVTVYGVNDSTVDWKGSVQYGIFSLDGKLPVLEEKDATLYANASTPLASFSLKEWETLGLKNHGPFAILKQDGKLVAQHRLFKERFKDLDFVTKPEVKLELNNGILTLVSEVFVWGVSLDLNGETEVSDNMFDLIPGIPYSVAWAENLGEPKVAGFGNRFF
ncbi:MAG: hypothetical protein GX804_11220, partial [Lentisphaerae bacterium]|nr:hypothetical protein [Lentisphaerota bacterium]